MLSYLIYSRPDIRVFSSLRSPGRHVVTPATQLLTPKASSRSPVSPTFKCPQDLTISHTFSTGTLVPATILSLLATKTASALPLPQSPTHRATGATAWKVKQSAPRPAFSPHQLSSHSPLFSACRVKSVSPSPGLLPSLAQRCPGPNRHWTPGERQALSEPRFPHL